MSILTQIKHKILGVKKETDRKSRFLKRINYGFKAFRNSQPSKSFITFPSFGVSDVGKPLLIHPRLPHIVSVTFARFHDSVTVSNTCTKLSSRSGQILIYTVRPYMEKNTE